MREEDFQIADGTGGELFQEKFLPTSKWKKFKHVIGTVADRGHQYLKNLYQDYSLEYEN